MIQHLRQEKEMVLELTGATEDQVALHDDGYWSRAYVVNGGEFVVKFPKYDTVDYGNEAAFLHLISGMDLPVNIQKLIWLAEDGRCLAVHGVRGTPLSELENLTTNQKRTIGKQIGLFLKQLHAIKPDFSGKNLDEELHEYRIAYDDCADFYAKHFSKEEQAALDFLMHTYLPTERRGFGENLVFCHADIWEPNILLDENGKVGIIDCSNAGFFDEAADFCVEDAVLRGFILEYYGADDILCKKVANKYDMSTITCPKFGIPLWGEPYVVEKWVPLIREVILKYAASVCRRI